ncbi:hypothetical protein Tco_0453263 [Tanacetum coccineum]
MHREVANCCRYLAMVVYHARDMAATIIQQHEELIINEFFLRRTQEYLIEEVPKKQESRSIQSLNGHPDMFAAFSEGAFKDDDGAKWVFFGGERFLEGISGEAYITIQRTDLNCPLGLELQLHITEAVCPALSEPGLRALLRFFTGVYVCLNRGNVNPNVQEHYSFDENCMSAFKGPLDPSTALGGFSGNNYSEASALIITYPVNNVIDRESNETKRAVAWEKAFIQLVQDELLPMVKSKNLTLSYSSESSIEEELKREYCRCYNNFDESMMLLLLEALFLCQHAGYFLCLQAVIAAFAALSLASIALCTRIQPGLEQQIVLPRDSYLQGYFNNVTEYLRIGPPL